MHLLISSPSACQEAVNRFAVYIFKVSAINEIVDEKTFLTSGEDRVLSFTRSKPADYESELGYNPLNNGSSLSRSIHIPHGIGEIRSLISGNPHAKFILAKTRLSSSALPLTP